MKHKIIKKNITLFLCVLLVGLLAIPNHFINKLFTDTTIERLTMLSYDSNHIITDPLYVIINTLSPYFICDHYISTEIFPGQPKSSYWSPDYNRNLIKGNNLLKNKNFDTIKDFDIIQCQIDHLNMFIDTFLPKINKKIILITSQCHNPQIYRSKKTDLLLNNNKIFLWISQNPIYKKHPKYMAFPYGICSENKYVYKYYTFLKNIKDFNKKEEVVNLYSSVHDHLPSNHIRKKYKILTENTQKLDYNDYLNKIKQSKFLISTSGDRDDSYRHYEAIGLGTIPISNIDYYEIFENNMYSTSEENLIKILKTSKCDIEYKEPNKNMIYLEYWKKKINDRISNLKKNVK